MTSFLFGIEVIFPVFFVIIVGIFLRKKEIVDQEFMSQASTLVFYFALPLKLFLDIYNSDLSNGINGTFTITIILLTLVTFILGWTLAIFAVERSKRSAFIHTAFRSNFVYVGYPIIATLIGSTSHPAIISVNLFILPLYNFLAIMALGYYGKATNGLASVVKSTLKNPMVIGTFLGIMAYFLPLEFPQPLLKGMTLFSSLATPLALLLIGMQLGQYFDRIPFAAILSGGFCVLIRPLIAIPILHMLSFTYEEFIVGLVLFTTPCAANSYVMTRKMGGDGDFAAKSILSSFLINIFSYPIIIYILQQFGWIYSL